MTGCHHRQTLRLKLMATNLSSPVFRTPTTPATNIVSVPSDVPRRCPRKGKDVVRDQHKTVSSPPVVREYLSVLREDEPPVIVNEVTTGMWINKDIIMRPCQEIFRYKDSVAVLEDVKSLRNKVGVKPTVIDVWLCILNDLEGRRPGNELCRFFASTVLSGRTIVDPEDSRRVRFEFFTEKIKEECDRTIIHSWGVLFVFPICMDDEYFMLCVDVKNEKHTIIDSSSSSPSTEARYGMIPEDLADLLSSFLDDLGLESQSRVVLASRPTRMRMGWRVRNNTVDSGVFTMRHMETYEGQEVEKWDCGLTKDDPNQAKNLRLQDIHAITTCGINAWRGKNMAYALDHEKQAGSPLTRVE